MKVDVKTGMNYFATNILYNFVLALVKTISATKSRITSTGGQTRTSVKLQLLFNKIKQFTFFKKALRSFGRRKVLVVASEMCCGLLQHQIA
jgi:hypothetical protein